MGTLSGYGRHDAPWRRDIEYLYASSASARRVSRSKGTPWVTKTFPSSKVERGCGEGGRFPFRLQESNQETPHPLHSSSFIDIAKSCGNCVKKFCRQTDRGRSPCTKGFASQAMMHLLQMMETLGAKLGQAVERRKEFLNRNDYHTGQH